MGRMVAPTASQISGRSPKKKKPSNASHTIEVYSNGATTGTGAMRNALGTLLATCLALATTVTAVGAAGYPAKDARMPRELFESGYTELQRFLPYRDPGISSALSRRLLGS